MEYDESFYQASLRDHATQLSVLRNERDKAVSERDTARRIVAAVEQWADTHGAALRPSAGSADTYGNGMRDAKRQVKAIVGRVVADAAKRR